MKFYVESLNFYIVFLLSLFVQFEHFSIRKDKVFEDSDELNFSILGEGIMLYRKNHWSFKVHMDARQLFNSIALLHFQGNHELR